jgi:hypothetical protein
MRDRYDGPQEDSASATAIKRAVNLLSFVFARIYFPTFSNGLKDIAGYLGFQWSGSPSSGLEAIVWRHQWEASRDLAAKQALIDYNQQDCEALELLSNTLVQLQRGASADDPSFQNNVVLTSEMKQESPFPFRFGRNTFALPELESINRAAYWDYQRDRICVKSRNKSTRERGRHSTPRAL